MKRFVQAFILFLGIQSAMAQTPVPMASQPALTYTEDFADIANWTNGFAAGAGANRFGAVTAGGSSAIPNADRTTASTVSFVTGSSSGIQRGTEQATATSSIVFLSTGTTNNTSAVAIDLFLDFTGVDAGTISFDWAVVFNSTGNRNGSFKVYASNDGTSFSDVTGAFVSDFTNNVAASGTISNVALPAILNNSATARLRFYYHNGVGGTTGSRPKLSLDNLVITAVPNIPCSTPTAQPSGLSFGTITSNSIEGSFTAASPAPNGYLLIVSNNSSLTAMPVNGINYNPGDNVGDGYVIAVGSSLNFTASGLSPLTNYYFFIFSMNNICNGGTRYLTVSPLTGNTSTPAGLPPCTTPASQPTGLVFGTTTINSIQGSFSATAADGYLVLRSTSASLSSNPVNTTTYAPGNILGNATVVQQSGNNSFTATGLAANSNYYFFVFSYNNTGCSNGPTYNTASPLDGSWSTANLSPCTMPTAQPNNISFTVSRSAIACAFNPGSGNDGYLVVRSLSPTLSSSPINNTDYNVGDALGGGNVIGNSSNRSYVTNGLTPATTYYFFVFALNKNCSGGTKYLTTNPLEGNAATTSELANNFYFGNLHAHSDYSDGNQDNPGYTPYDNYNYAMASQCMDYLGISEHNHYAAGTRLSNYQLGVTQAASFTTANPGFVALYGMEWGVISGGGHVLVYGDGMNELWGWESGSGSWGSGNNYNTFVAKNDYTGANGLFKTINNNAANQTFATLAHPNNSDFGNLSNIAYNVVADDAITGIAVETGPSTSTNTSYSNPGSSMAYLWYYQKMLAKGYHVGPSIDHDNHNTTFGRTTYSRTAAIAPNKTRAEIIRAFRNINFYATQDCDSRVDFTVNTRIMGSSVTAAGAPIISVVITDATTSTAGAIIKVMFGLPGSNTNATEIYSATGSSLSFVDNNLANLATGYYYIDISNGSSRIITAPVWYTRLDNGVLPVSFSSFTAQKVEKSVKLNWTTEQEVNSSRFVVERSADGSNWFAITQLPAAGNSSNRLTYTAFDNLPLQGKGYYRIKQVDADGRTQLSVVRNVKFEQEFQLVVSPNPATDLVTISWEKQQSNTCLVQLYDAGGNLVYSEKSNQSQVKIQTSGMRRGLYVVKISNAQRVITQKLLLQ